MIHKKSVAATGLARAPLTGLLWACLFVFIVTALAEWMGSVQFTVGPGKVLLLPMVWALLMGTAWAALHRQLPGVLKVPVGTQQVMESLLNAALLVFIAKLSLTVGGSLDKVKDAGWALMFQEFGHVFGTLIVALPLALILGIKREAVGATFSVGRENNLAIISEKYGMSSPEGRGVLAEYITGTVLGALFIAVLAGFIASLNIFDPRSLAMGAGVGSGSMMAAGIGAITAQSDPALKDTLLALAAASNLLTIVGGFYFTMFLSLPTASWLYNKLEPRIGRWSRRGQAPQDSSGLDAGQFPGVEPFSLSTHAWAWGLMIIGVSLANSWSGKVPFKDSFVGMCVVVGIVAVVTVIKHFWKKMPLLLILATVTTLLGAPGVFQFATTLQELTKPLGVQAFTTLLLALAGFAVAKDLPIFMKLGWRIVLVSLTAAAGTFMGATLIAEFFH